QLSLDHHALEEVVDGQAAQDGREENDEREPGELPGRARPPEPLAHPAATRASPALAQNGRGWAHSRRALVAHSRREQQSTYRSEMTEEMRRRRFVSSNRLRCGRIFPGNPRSV